MPDGELESDLFDDFSGLAEDVVDFASWTVGGGALVPVARTVAAGLRGECMSVRLPGIPFAEHISDAADWWGEKFTSAFGRPAAAARYLHDCVTTEIQDFVGVDIDGGCPVGDKPRLSPRSGPPDDGYMVSVPAWEDIFQFNNNSVFDPRSKKQRAIDYAESLRRSPTPPSLREVGEILTTLDDLQDEAATLAVALMIVEKVAGRAIPGVGTVATIADALNIISALAIPATGSGLAGRRGKRLTVDASRSRSNGYRGRLERSRRVDDFQRTVTAEQSRLKPQIKDPAAGFKLGWSDALQALQATDSLFGFGISIGPIMGFLQDAFWLGIRGGELRIPGRAVDPFGFTDIAKSNCYRSPRLEDVHPMAFPVLANEAMQLWSHVGRVMPYADVLGEHALASMLTGMRLSEQVLGTWLRSGAWVEPLATAMNMVERVRGGVAEHELRNLRADEWVKRTAPANTVALRKAIANVPDRGRQQFYESVASSVAWGLVADLDPGAIVKDLAPHGYMHDAVTLLESNKFPVFDLGD